MFAFVDFIDYMVNTKRKEYMYMVYMVFTTDGFFEVAIETLPEWDLSLRPLKFHSDALTD